MTETVVSSATKEVVIGFERPFCIIGERINPTGRKQLAAQMAAGDYSEVEADALAQVAAGAHMLDVNAGIPLADEPQILAETIQLVQSLIDVPLSIDSSIVAALEAGLAVYQGKPLVNSVTGEDERLESVLPLIRKYGAAVVAISNDETGISEDPDVRYEVAKKIVERAEDHGIPRADVVVDPLVMPVGALGNAGRAAFHLIRRLREELKVNTTCGASNISFGLPNRHALNATFLAMAIGAGMTSAIMNPLHAEETGAIKGADVLMGHDRDCRRWLRAYREPSADGRRPARAPPPAGMNCGARVTDTPLVVFTPSGKRGRFPLGTPLLQAARELGVDVDSVCGGRALCGRCQVTLSEGEFAKHGISSRADHISPPSPTEERYRARNKQMQPGRRLSCQAEAARRRRDRRAARQPGAQAGRPEARRGPRDRARSGGAAALRRGRAARHAAPAGDLQRLQEALAEQWQLGELTCDLRSLQGLQKALRQGALEGHGRGPFGQPHHRRSGRASTIAPTASRSTSARPRSPPICAISRAARCSPRPG